MKNKKQAAVILHGEAMIFPSKLPKNAKSIKPTNREKYLDIALN